MTPEEKKLEKIVHILEAANADFITPDQLVETVDSVISIIADLKDNSETSVVKIQEYVDEISKVVNKNRELSAKEFIKVSTTLNSLKDELKNSIASLKKEIVAQIPTVPSLDPVYKAIENVKYNIPTQESILRSVLANIPKQKVIEGEYIVNQINDLPTSNDKYKIDASHIKNLPKLLAPSRNWWGSGGTNSGSGNITGLISQGTNITITGTGTLLDPYIINSSGSGGSLIGQTSGVISAPTPGATFETWYGDLAGGAGTSTDYTILMGIEAGYNAPTAGNLIAIGYQAGLNDTVNNNFLVSTVTYTGLTGGTFNIGDTVTLSPYISYGTILTDDGVGTMIVDMMGSPDFLPGDVIRNAGAVVTATVATVIPAFSSILNPASTSILIGNGATTQGFPKSIALGYNAYNTASNQFKISADITDVTFPYLGGSGNGSVLVNNDGKLTFSSGTLPQYYKEPSSAPSVAPTTASTGAIAIGDGASIGISSTNSFALGTNATISQGTTSTYAIGDGANVGAGNGGAYAIGQGATVAIASSYSYAIGSFATTSNFYAYAIGAQALAAGLSSFAIGTRATSAFANSYAIGGRATTTAANQLVFGGRDSFSGIESFTDVYFGGVVDLSGFIPTTFTIHTKGGTGADIAGASMNFEAGIATGNALGGEFNWATSDVGSTGTTAQTVTDKMHLYTTGAFQLYKYGINTFAGTPTYALGVDATGNVVEFAVGGGGGSPGGSNGQIQYNNSGAFGGIAGTSAQFIKGDGSLDSNTYLTGNQTITLSGEASGSGATSIAVTLSNAAVIAKVLTGYTSGAGTVSATDSILQAIQKLNGNIGALATGVSNVSGTTNRITSTGGATPVIDISASYVGQSSITTLGTITTGVWNGTTINYAYLGSGGGGATKFLREDNTWQTVSGGGGLTVGTTTISSGATTRILYNNAGILGEYTITGTGTVVAMQTSPTFITPLLGTPTSGVLTNCTGYTGANLVLTDITTNNVTSTAHGFAPKSPGDSTQFLNGGATPGWTSLTNTQVTTITFIFDGGGSTLTTGIKGDLEIPFGYTINSWTLLSDQSGSIVIDIWVDTYANFPPTVADTITASAKPTITTATKGQSSTLTGWNTTGTAGNTLRFNIDSVTSCQRVTLSLKVTKT